MPPAARRLARALRRLARAGRPAAVLEARVAYERLAGAYPPVAHNPLMVLDEETVLELLPADLHGRRALDLGCGSGRYLALLAGRGAQPVGCDLSAAMLQRAHSEWGGPSAPLLVRADLRELPFGAGAFDLAVCALTLGHVAELERALGELARVLRPGGLLVYSDLHPAGTLAGWRRELPTAGGQRLEVRQHLHLFADHLGACRAAGLELEAAREPRLAAPHPQHGWPALLVLRARRGA